MPWFNTLGERHKFQLLHRALSSEIPLLCDMQDAAADVVELLIFEDLGLQDFFLHHDDYRLSIWILDLEFVF